MGTYVVAHSDTTGVITNNVAACVGGNGTAPTVLANDLKIAVGNIAAMPVSRVFCRIAGSIAIHLIVREEKKARKVSRWFSGERFD